MRTRIILQLATFLVITFGTSINGLFFHYPKNVLHDFFQSFHQKKEIKKPVQNIHHYHLHYFPIYPQYLPKPAKAPAKMELDTLYSNKLETLGWGDSEYKNVPDPEIYRTSPLSDPWPDSSITRSTIWDDEIPNYPYQTLEQPESSKAGIVVQVPIHQNFLVQQPPAKEEKNETNPLIAFIRGFQRIKNTLFNHDAESDKADDSNQKPVINTNLNGYVVYVNRDFGRKL